MVKVSVVIPVYNVENYVRDCLDSIVNQTLTDIEIICINDGSPDNSLDILYEYANKDKRITVIDQENGGHAVATNRGIELATGECLFLMDSDDVLELNALELSFNRLKEKDVDFVIFKAINYNDAEDRYYETEVYSMNKIYNKVGDEVFNYQDIGDLMFQASVTPWSKLYKRDFVNNEHIRFPEGLIFEDNVFFFKALLKAKRICFLNEFLFIRRWYSTSSTTNGDLRFLDSISVANLIIQVFKENNEFDNYKRNILDNKISLNFMRYTKIKKEFKETFFQEMKKDFIKILHDKSLYKDFLDVISYRNRRIFEQVIISENSFELELLRQIYNNQMKNYVEVNSLDKNAEFNSIFSYYLDSLGENENSDEENDVEYNEFLFNQVKQDFIEILKDDSLFESFKSHTNYHNQKIFEQVILSESYYEFRYLREIYENQMLSYDFIESFNPDLNKLLNNIENNLRNMNHENYFVETQSKFKYIISNKGLYDYFLNKLNYHNKKLFEQILISQNIYEFILLRRICDLKNKNQTKLTSLNSLRDKYSHMKDFNESLLNSNSWKLTKIFRKLN